MKTQTNQAAAGQGPEAGGRRSKTSDPRAGDQTMTSGVPVEPFIRKPEVARRLQRQVRTVDNWMKRGILPYYKIGRSVAFKWSEIEVALARTCRIYRGRGLSDGV